MAREIGVNSIAGGIGSTFGATMRAPRIVDRGEHAVGDLAVPFRDLVPLLLHEQLQFFVVRAHGVDEVPYWNGRTSASASRITAVPTVCASARP